MSPRRSRSEPGSTDRHIDALLALLADNPMIVISGAKVARQIGVSRKTVWRWVEQLRSAGVKVKGHARTGYQIERIPDVLAPQVVKRHLAGVGFGRRIDHYFKIGSTNDAAMALGREGAEHGAVVVAEEQTAGRGRAGRPWISERSAGIHVSVLLRPAIPPAQAPLLALVSGLAARDAIAEASGKSPDIRWPNDVLLGGKKLCGILVEMNAEPDRIHYAVAGIGINVNQTKMPTELSSIATSLRMETGRAHSRLELLGRLLRHLDRYYNDFIARGAGPILAHFAEVSSFCRGKRVRITAPGESYVGVTDGLETSGVLRVRRDDGRVEAVVAGDVAEAN